MKKLFAFLSLTVAMAACNNSSETKEATADTTKTESPLMDAVNTADSAGKMMMSDTTHNMMMSTDTTKK